jgi:5-methylcytosine-specific restriction endonuclease McrA
VSTVLVLNAGYEPLHRVSVKHAIRMLVRQVAVVEEADSGAPLGPFPRPRVLRLVRYVHMRWRTRRTPPWTRDGLFRRDGHRCGYCGRSGVELTVDHIVPRSRGGTTTWENTVAACGGSRGCNARKGSKSPEQAGLTLLVTPHVPTAWELV